jgi:uncharacterized protein (TIGR04255 family)
MLEFLKPISGDHSINRVIAAIHIPQAFLKPELLLNKITNISDFNKYQKKALSKVKTINIIGVNPGVSSEEIKGFVLEEYDNFGKLSNILRLNNLGDNQSIFSLENRIYEDWDIFLPLFKKDVDSLSSILEIFIEALSLSYIDEFTWESSKKIDVESIFNGNSELLNKKFLNSENGTLISISQDKNSESEIDVEEKVEISFNNRLKRISINHQCAIKLDEIKLYPDISNSADFERYFNKAHELNKVMLKDVLSKECLDLIKIK